MARLIGINGFKTAGKDTAAGIIKGLNADTVRLGFADNLKHMASLAIGQPDAADLDFHVAKMNECKETWRFEIYRPTSAGRGEERVKTFTGREYLQWFGGYARQVFGDTFWIDQVLPNHLAWTHKHTQEDVDAELERKHGSAEIYVVTDVRYENEAQRVRDLGGEIWEIVRPGLQSDGHGSEITLPRKLVDVTLHNDGTITDLQDAVRDALVYGPILL